MKSGKINRFQFLMVLATILLLVNTVHSQEKSYDQLLGTWNLLVVVEGAEQYSFFSFDAANDSLTGYWDGDMGLLPIKNVSFAGDTLRGLIIIDSPDGILEITILAEVKEGKMKGSGFSQFGELFPFTATRQKKKN